MKYKNNKRKSLKFLQLTLRPPPKKFFFNFYFIYKYNYDYLKKFNLTLIYYIFLHLKNKGWLDPRSLVTFFEQNGITAWLDINELGATNSSNKSLFNEITKGMNLAKVIVCCFSDEYTRAKNCILEFRFAHVSLKTPIIKAIVGTGNNWRRNELSFLSGDYPEVNFQVENCESYENLLEFVRIELENVRQKSVERENRERGSRIERAIIEQKQADQNTAAFQEL